MLELLAFQTNLQNTFPENEFSYYVIDGFPCQAPNRLSVMPIDQKQGEIVLASDGYPRLFPTLAETEACLAGVLKEDPLCYKLYRTTKGRYGDNLSFDDRTYVRFTY
jgi:glycerophosphoryl diester phosphodiesterase